MSSATTIAGAQIAIVADWSGCVIKPIHRINLGAPMRPYGWPE